MLADDRFSAEDLGPHLLRNLSNPVRLYSIRGTGTASFWPLDPVCRMALDPARAAVTLRTLTGEYHFCSLQCAARFDEAPERYHREDAFPAS